MLYNITFYANNSTKSNNYLYICTNKTKKPFKTYNYEN